MSDADLAAMAAYCFLAEIVASLRPKADKLHHQAPKNTELIIRYLNVDEWRKNILSRAHPAFVLICGYPVAL